MKDAQKEEFRLSFAGVVPKGAADLLKDGQYRFAQNVMSIQEGSISSRNGSNTLGQFTGIAGVTQIRKLVLSPKTNPIGDITNLRYMSMNATLFRTSSLAVAPTQVTGSFLPLSGPGLWEMASYFAGSSGNPWAFFATSSFMYKDNGLSPYSNPLHNWGILPAYGVAQWVDAGVGNLDGGAAASPSNSQPYDWVTTYFAGDTNNQGNPAQAMLTNSAIGSGGQPAAVHLRQVTLTVWGSDDPQVTNIYIYRRGGIFSDGIYRLVLVIANPGTVTTTTATDNVADPDLVLAPQMQTDNNPPVTSTVPTPIRGTITAIAGGNPGGNTVLTVTISTLLLATVTRGSLLHFTATSGGAISESAIVQSTAPISQRITVYTQLTHVNGEFVEIDAITNQACTLALQYQNALLVAGDPNNPQRLYKSKTGFPESFPVGTDAAGALTQMDVGSPSNGILNMIEFRGQVLLLNVSAMYEVTIVNGSLITPFQVATKGLLVRDGFCKTEAEIWLVATDGIYSWDGGTFRKRSEMIDTLFHGEVVNGMTPIQLEVNPYIRMAYARNRIHVLYQDLSGNFVRIVCEPLYNDRWTIDTDNGNPTQVIYTEPDTQGLVDIRESGSLNTITIDDRSAVFSGQTFTSDIWSGSDPRSSGFAISWALKLPWFDMGDPASQKIHEEVLLDLDPQLYTGVYPINSNISADIYLDYSETPTETINIAIPTGSSYTGRVLVSLLPNLLTRTAALQSFGWEARAISFQLRGAAYPTQPTLYRLLFRYNNTGDLTAGGTGDWMDLGHPYDKRLQVMRLTFDVRGVNQQVALDTMNGISGNTFNEDVTGFFTLSNPVIDGNGRCTKAFPLPDALPSNPGLIAKLVRVRPVATATLTNSTNVLFKILDVAFEFAKFPPDIVDFTEPQDFGWPYEKIPRTLQMLIDTGGIACSVNLLSDSTVVAGPFSVTTTLDDWSRVITLPSNLTGRIWKLQLTPGANGKAQLFSWSLPDFIKLPPAVTLWDSYEQTFGYFAYKVITQIWINYQGASNITLSIFTDQDTLFFSTVLSPNAHRDTVRFYLPSANSGVLNKAKVYRITLTSSTAFTFYLQGSGVQFMPLGSDRFMEYQRMTLAEIMGLGEAA